jgi:hypothetical protein
MLGTLSSLEINHDGRCLLPPCQVTLPRLAEGQSALLRAMSNIDEKNRDS